MVTQATQGMASTKFRILARMTTLLKVTTKTQNQMAIDSKQQLIEGRWLMERRALLQMHLKGVLDFKWWDESDILQKERGLRDQIHILK